MSIDEDYQEYSKTSKAWGCIWNVLTVLVLIGIIGVIGVFILIFSNPNIGLNPFPPPTLQAAVVQSSSQPTATEAITATPTKEIFPPTWTPTTSLMPIETETPTPVVVSATSTPVATSTPEGVISTATDSPDMSFAVIGVPAAFSRTYIYPGADCNWLGVGGQVLDMQDAPIVGMSVKLGGKLGNNVLDMTGLTGTVLQYGTAGYEFTLSDKPVASHQTLWVQLLDQAGLPLSSKVYFDTYDDCQKNLILITFKQVR